MKIGNLKNFNQNLEYFLFIKAMFHKSCYGSAFAKALKCSETLFSVLKVLKEL